MLFNGKKLKDLRDEKGITQQKIFQETGVTQQSQSLWENGKRTPNINDLIKIADFFECSLDFLVGRSDDFGNVIVKKESPMTEKESTVLELFRQLPSPYQSQVIEYTSYIVERQKGINFNKTI